MDAVTYPEAKVVDFVTQNVIPLRIPFDSQPLSGKFQVKWTPTLILLDEEGNEHHRCVGFLGPEEFIPFLMLGIGKVHFETDRLDDAAAMFEKALSSFPQSTSVPEAIFYKGVCGYKRTHQTGPLKEAYERLNRDFPDSEWAKRAYPYRLL